MHPTPLEKTLRRVLVIAGIDGWSIAVFAGLCTLVSLLLGQWLGVMIGAFITAAGVLELFGRSRLVHNDASGTDLLIRAQVMILVIVWVYALHNLFSYDEAALLGQLTPQIRQLIAQLGLSIADLQPLMKPIYVALYLTVMGVTLIFQGGLALYYLTQRTRIAGAINERAALEAHSPQL